MFCWWFFLLTSWMNIYAINLGYLFIYMVDLPFFEQYKVQKDKPWPWKVNYPDWHNKVMKACFAVFFNNTITSTIVFYTYAHFSNW